MEIERCWTSNESSAELAIIINGWHGYDIGDEERT